MNGERGAALLLMFLILFAVASTLVIKSLPATPQIRQRDETFRQLQEAREALLAYAVTYEDNYLLPSHPPPGYLPCPNLQLPEKNESPDPPCDGHIPIIGRLPRRFPMGPGIVYEGIPAGVQRGEEFWYVLSPGFQNNHHPHTLNTTSSGRLSVDGHGGIVAMILAPGAPLAGQQRPDTDVHDYLEGENADGDNDFATGGEEMNDLAVFITATEFHTRLAQRVAADMKQLLDRAFDRDGAYPIELPAALPEWYADNWKGVTSYHSTGATATLRFTGCAITFTLGRGAPPARDKSTCG